MTKTEMLAAELEARLTGPARAWMHSLDASDRTALLEAIVACMGSSAPQTLSALYRALDERANKLLDGMSRGGNSERRAIVQRLFDQREQARRMLRVIEGHTAEVLAIVSAASQA